MACGIVTTINIRNGTKLYGCDFENIDGGRVVVINGESSQEADKAFFDAENFQSLSRKSSKSLTRLIMLIRVELEIILATLHRFRIHRRT